MNDVMTPEENRARVAKLLTPTVTRLPNGQTCRFHGQDPRARMVNDLMRKGYAAVRIADEVTESGFRVSKDAVSRHRRLCFVDETNAQAEARNEDLATLVRDQARRALLSGRLQVTTKDGLMAQNLLDKREERAKDRDFMLNLAQLLSGGGRAAPQDLIEGTAIDVTPAHNPLLAPPELRDEG
jgi:hypothetical protein